MWNQDFVVNEYWIGMIQKELSKTVACIAKKECLTQGDAEALEHLAKVFHLTDTDFILRAAQRRSHLRAGQVVRQENDQN